MGNGEITISFKLHMTINEINTTLLLECHYQSLLSVCNNFWLRSNVDFGQMMRQKYVVSYILEEFDVEDMKSSDAKASKCHLKFSSKMSIFIMLLCLCSIILL